MSSLFIVSTPIGNLRDLSWRAMEILSKVDRVICEDTRRTGRLLSHWEIKVKKLVSFFEGNEAKRIPQIIDWINQGQKIALVSSAGTPLVSDPGFKLVRECVKRKIKVVPIPGPSALLAGLVVSGLPTDKFVFLGFLPKKQGKKERLLKKAIESEMTVIFFESPFRIIKTLELLDRLQSKLECVLARELTKKFEEVLRGSPKELTKKLKSMKIRGELVMMLR